MRRNSVCITIINHIPENVVAILQVSRGRRKVEHAPPSSSIVGVWGRELRIEPVTLTCRRSPVYVVILPSSFSSFQASRKLPICLVQAAPRNLSYRTERNSLYLYLRPSSSY